ncbi:hypothetical protein Peur_004561 [Populus x canadensis]
MANKKKKAGSRLKQQKLQADQLINDSTVLALAAPSPSSTVHATVPSNSNSISIPPVNFTPVCPHPTPRLHSPPLDPGSQYHPSPSINHVFVEDSSDDVDYEDEEVDFDSSEEVSEGGSKLSPTLEVPPGSFAPPVVSPPAPPSPALVSPALPSSVAPAIPVSLAKPSDADSSKIEAAVLPNGNLLCQKVIYETLPKFCKSCQVLGHSTGACPKNKAAPRPVEKNGTEQETVLSKGSVFSRLSPPPVAVPIDPPTNSLVVTPPCPQLNTSAEVPKDPQFSGNAPEAQHCEQAPGAVVSEGWETVRKKKHGNKHHSPSPKVLPAVNNRSSTQPVSSKGKAPTFSVDTLGSKALPRPSSSKLTRSSIHRIPHTSSGSGGIAPTLPHP